MFKHGEDHSIAIFSILFMAHDLIDFFPLCNIVLFACVFLSQLPLK